MLTNQSQLVGQGWSFPIRANARGGIHFVRGEQEIEQAIYLILSTAPGERPMRPEFGCRANEYVFAPADSTTAGLLALEVRAALHRWEPRIEVDDVIVTADDQAPDTLWIDIKYQVRDSYDRRNLVFPFYVIPTESG